MNSLLKYSLLFLAASLLVMLVLLPIVSEHPDGLEKVAEKLGFANNAIENKAPMPNYNSEKGYAVLAGAGIIGSMIVLLLCLGTGYIALKRQN
jgi:hypothetical protein